MVADLSASAYLVDGTDLAVSGVELTHDGAGLWAGLAEDIGVATSAGADGGTATGGVFPPFTHSTMYSVSGDSYDDVWAEIVALRRRCKLGRTVVLTRRMPDPDGTAANTDQTATARRQNDRISWVGPTEADVDIDWLVTSGKWIGGSVAIGGAGTATVKGDLPTKSITATLSGGAANPVVTNTSNGYTFRYVGTVPTGGVVVDVLRRTATRITGGADVSSALKWSKRDLFQLDPGAQTLTVSVGTVSFTYLPAYS